MYIQGVSYPSDFEAKKAIIEAGKRMEEKGYALGCEGSLSVRVGPNAVWITTADADKGALTQDMLLRVDMNGRPGVGAARNKRLPEDLQTHLKVYAAGGEIYAILHAYPENVVVAGLCGNRLSRADFSPAARELGEIELLSDASAESAANAAAARCSVSRGILLKGDGCFVWGKSVREAFLSLETLEKAARIADRCRHCAQAGHCRGADAGRQGVCADCAKRVSCDGSVCTGFRSGTVCGGGNPSDIRGGASNANIGNSISRVQTGNPAEIHLPGVTPLVRPGEVRPARTAASAGQAAAGHTAAGQSAAGTAFVKAGAATPLIPPSGMRAVDVPKAQVMEAVVKKALAGFAQ